jgi:hypothetical protein
MTDFNAPDPNGSDNGNGKNGNGTNAWPMWQRLVLAELERHDKNQKEFGEKADKEHKEINDRITTVITNDLGTIKTEIAVIKTKASIYGALAGMGLSLLIEVMMKVLPHLVANIDKVAR